VRNGDLTLRLTYHSTTYYVYFCTYGFQPFSNAHWDRTYYFQVSPVTFGPIPYTDPRSPLYGIVRISSPYHRVALEKPCVLSTILIGLRLAVTEL